MVREMRVSMLAMSPAVVTRLVVGCGAMASLAAALTLDIAAAPAAQSAAKPVRESYSANVPPVLLSAEHAQICKLALGDQFPAIELPTLEGAATKVADLAKGKPTIVLFWTPDRWMSRAALADVNQTIANANGQEIAAVAIVEGAVNDGVKQIIADSGAKFPQLTDADGAAFAQVGEQALPRIFVLDKAGKVAWFDIEFSEASRREMQQALAALAK